MKKVRWFWLSLFILALAFFIFSCAKSSVLKEKTIYECDKAEKGAVEFILEKSCQEVLGDKIVAYYDTTSYQIPEKSGYIGETGGYTKPKKPIKALSVSYEYSDKEITPADFEKSILNRHAKWQEGKKTKRLGITKVIVEIIPGGGSGGLYSPPRDMVTLIPLEVGVID